MEPARSPRHLSDEELHWVGVYLPEIRASLTGQRLLYESLVTGFVLGLIAHIAGYVLRAMGLLEPFALLADLLYALGFALWTGVVVAAFVQLYPQVKRRQIAQALREYEQARQAGEHESR
jgi:hypothetical protein